MTRISARYAGLLTTLGGWPRRVAAVGCLIGAVLSVVAGHSTAPAPSATVLVASRQLSPGASVQAGDVRVAHWPAAELPTGALAGGSAVIGHRIAAAMARGEPFTAARLLDTGFSQALRPGQVAATLTLATANQAAIVQAGALVDVYPAADGNLLADGQPVAGAASAAALASDLRVLAVLPAGSATVEGANTGTTADDLPTMVVAADRSTAARLAAHASGSFLATLIRPP